MMNAIALLFLVAVVLPVPLALRRVHLQDPTADRGLALVRWISFPAAVLLAASFALPNGPVAALLAVPWLLAGVTALTLAGADAVLDRDRFRLDIRQGTRASLVFLAVGAVNAAADRLGVQPFGFPPVIVLLTAVHFHVAGTVLVILGVLATERTGSRAAGLSVAALVIGMPVTAVAFFGVGVATPIGSFLVAGGGLGIAIATMRSASTFDRRVARVLSHVAGIGLMVAMPLAIAYAVGSWLGVAWLDLSTMARTHGLINALVVAIPATVAWTLDAR